MLYFKRTFGWIAVHLNNSHIVIIRLDFFDVTHSKLAVNIIAPNERRRERESDVE